MGTLSIVNSTKLIDILGRMKAVEKSQECFLEIK